jgi:F-type H+-transporting ATPase subunit gamma
MMKFLCLAAVLATATAFTAGPSAFQSATVGERAINNVFAESGSAHRTRRATIVMDGKANGE